MGLSLAYVQCRLKQGHEFLLRELLSTSQMIEMWPGRQEQWNVDYCVELTQIPGKKNCWFRWPVDTLKLIKFAVPDGYIRTCSLQYGGGTFCLFLWHICVAFLAHGYFSVTRRQVNVTLAKACRPVSLIYTRTLGKWLRLYWRWRIMRMSFASPPG